MYVSDTEDDCNLKDQSTFDHVLEVSAEALSKVTVFYFSLVFKLTLIFIWKQWWALAQRH